MTAILMKNLNGMRRATLISKVDAEAMVADGKATQDKVHASIYEEASEGEIKQGYMTRDMQPIVKRGPGRPPKVPPAPVFEDTPAAK